MSYHFTTSDSINMMLVKVQVVTWLIRAVVRDEQIILGLVQIFINHFETIDNYIQPWEQTFDRDLMILVKDLSTQLYT